MILEQIDIFVGKFASVHISDTVSKKTTVQADEVLLRKLTDQCGDVLLLHICICVILRACSCIRCITVRSEEVKLVLDLTILHMFLTIKDIALCHSIIMLCHKGHLYLVLDLLHTHSVLHADSAEDTDQIIFRRVAAFCKKSLADCILDLVYRERFAFAVSLYYAQFRTSHI